MEKPRITITDDIGTSKDHKHVGVIEGTDETIDETDSDHFWMGITKCTVCNKNITGRRWESFSGVFHRDCVVISNP